MPKADHWRSNISSYIWDDVILKIFGDAKIEKIIPDYNLEEKEIELSYELSGYSNKKEIKNYDVSVQIKNKEDVVVFNKIYKKNGLKNHIKIPFWKNVKLWSPLDPNLYTVTLLFKKGRKIIDSKTISLGIKKTEIREKQFYLNNQPLKITAGTVVWHRWSRDWGDKDLLYDEKWFIKNVITPLKERGANTLRFHLGNPPDRFLKLCDQYGLLVQYEWIFFHGLPASKSSLLEQWGIWIDQAFEHPSIGLIHPYNETGGNQLKTAWSVLDELLAKYPAVIMEERDVLHLHKYWWSLFENLGLYYDSYDEFPKAIMVDEFGGNYLDGNGDMGDYPTVKEAFLRFLGKEHTRKERLKHHSNSNTKVAEYWRRIGAAGFSPFCILGSQEDGSHWYLGDMESPELKPVWNDLTTTWSPKSVSMDLWDANFTPNQLAEIPIHLFNDTPNSEHFKIKISIENDKGELIFENTFFQELAAYSKKVELRVVQIPKSIGYYTIKTTLLNPTKEVKYPVVSKWDIRVLNPQVSSKVKNLKIGIPKDEKELIAFIEKMGLERTSIENPKADLLLFSRVSWNKIAKNDKALLGKIEKAIDKGVSVLMLDVGDLFLGQGYVSEKQKMSRLQGAYKIQKNETNVYPFIKGTELTFKKVAEPESHIHQANKNNVIWSHLPKESTWLWNGLKGGLIVPANEIEVSGLSSKAFLSKWKTKGADTQSMKNKLYYAYELQGYYEFSEKANDKELQKKLKDKVAFLVEDAPALATSINPNAKIISINLNKDYLKATLGEANEIISLAIAGRNLNRAPLIQLDFGENKGNVILSQLITKGRLFETQLDNKKGYETKFDPAAVQMVLNMLERLSLAE